MSASGQSSSAKPIPVILCGKSTTIATAVKEALLPEYEVIYVILTSEAAISHFPSLLAGKKPQVDHDGNLGTQNFSLGPPRAVILGAGYNNNDIAAIRAVCSYVDNEGKEQVLKIPWLKPDEGKQSSPDAPPLGPQYGIWMVNRVKECLGGLRQEGKLGWEGGVGAGFDGIYFY